MTDEVLEVAAPVVPEAAPVAAPAPVAGDEPEFDAEAEFQRHVAKRGLDGSEPKAVEDTPEPAPTPVAGAEPVAPVAAAPAVVAPKEDWIELLPEDRRDAAKARLAEADALAEKNRKLENDNRSLAGRMSAYQRRYEEAAGKRPVDVAKQATAEESAEWTQFKEDYPDIAKAIEARVPAEAGATPELSEVVEYVQTQKRERFLHDAWDAVEAIHPGWRSTGVTPEFQAWKKSSPTYEKLASSDDVADAVALFDLYNATRAKAPEPTPQEAAAAQALAARRGAQVEGALAPTHKAASPSSTVDANDPDQLFAFYAQKANSRLKERHR